MKSQTFCCWFSSIFKAPNFFTFMCGLFLLGIILHFYGRIFAAESIGVFFYRGQASGAGGNESPSHLSGLSKYSEGVGGALSLTLAHRARTWCSKLPVMEAKAAPQLWPSHSSLSIKLDAESWEAGSAPAPSPREQHRIMCVLLCCSVINPLQGFARLECITARSIMPLDWIRNCLEKLRGSRGIILLKMQLGCRAFNFLSRNKSLLWVFCSAKKSMFVELIVVKRCKFCVELCNIIFLK
jgi:hypothetical protein